MTTRITFNVSAQFHKVIKTYATLQGQTIKDYIIAKLKECISHDLSELKASVPNKATVKALAETKDAELEEFDNTEYLFEALDKIEADAKD